MADRELEQRIFVMKQEIRNKRDSSTAPEVKKYYRNLSRYFDKIQFDRDGMRIKEVMNA